MGLSMLDYQSLHYNDVKMNFNIDLVVRNLSCT